MVKLKTIFKHDDKNKSKNDEKNWFQILAIATSSISSATAGMLFVWTSPSIPKIITDKTNYDISLEEASYFTVIPPITAMIFSLVFAKLNDIIGRKYTLWFIAIPQILSLILIATAKSVYVFYISRAFTGVGDAILFISLPMYIGEVSTPKVRGSWGNLITFAIYLGQFLVNVIGSYLDVPSTAYICLLFPIIFAVAFFFMPETPYFYMMKEREEDARKSLQKLMRKENVEEELSQLKEDVRRQMSESGTWRDIFTIRSNRKAVYAGIFLRASQQFGGIGSFAVYTQYIFLQAGGNVSASTSAIIFTFLCMILNFCSAFTLDKLGRRNSYLFSLLLCGIVLFLEAVYFFIDEYHSEIDVTFLNWIPITGMILYVVFYSFGLGIVPTLMLGELFSASIKVKGLCLLNIIFGALISFVTKLFHILETNFGLFAPFLFFAVSCLISTVLSFYFVPETKGKTLEEIQQSLKKKKVKKSDNPT